MGWEGTAIGVALAAAYGLVAGRLVAERLAAGAHRRSDDERARPTPSYRPIPFVVALAAALPAAALLSGAARPDGVAPSWPGGYAVAAATTAVAYALVAPLLVALAAVDLDVHRLPDRLTLPAYPAVAGALATACLAGAPWEAWRRGLLGSLALLAVFGILHLVSRGRFGFGDVKLAGTLGLLLAWLSWGRLVGGAYAMFLVGGLTAVILIMRRRADRDTPIAFGPAMVTGTLLGICLPG